MYHISIARGKACSADLIFALKVQHVLHFLRCNYDINFTQIINFINFDRDSRCSYSWSGHIIMLNLLSSRLADLLGDCVIRSSCDSLGKVCCTNYIDGSTIIQNKILLQAEGSLGQVTYVGGGWVGKASESDVGGDDNYSQNELLIHNLSGL
jgi:hypothetical protein